MGIDLKPVEKFEVLMLIDNYVDLLSQDNSDVVQRAIPLKDMAVKNSVLAEHGFASLVTVTADDTPRSLLFDFGFSEHGAAFNAEALSADVGSVEIMALSHGHLDHFGGLPALSRLVGKKGIKLVLHPKAFKAGRCAKISDDLKFTMPSFTREQADAAGVEPVVSATPYPMLGNTVAWLGEIPKETDFEIGAPNLCYTENGRDRQDLIEDDTAIVAHVKGKGLVVLSGCAHSGIVNTIRCARKFTGIEKVHAVVGGFHLSGPDTGPVIEKTIDALKEIDPDYVVPAHCTGRQAALAIEKAMPEKFILNMAGTRLTFSA